MISPVPPPARSSVSSFGELSNELVPASALSLPTRVLPAYTPTVCPDNAHLFARRRKVTAAIPLLLVDNARFLKPVVDRKRDDVRIEDKETRGEP
jgi:hypothetical protein